METKGVAVILTKQYVKSKFRSQYDEWLNSLSPDSREIVESAITSTWYPLKTGLVEPTRKLCDLLHGGREEGARDAGRYCAEHALKGVYNVFMREGQPEYVVGRAGIVFANYFRPCRADVIQNGPNQGAIQITEFAEASRLIEQRMAGWLERAIEVSGGWTVSVKITRSLAGGDKITELLLSWSQPLNPSKERT